MTTNGLESLTVARFEEGAQAAAAQELAEDSIKVGAGVATFFEPGSSLNQAWNQGLYGPIDDEDVDAIVDFFTERGIEARLPVCSLADASLVTALASQGFVTDAFINVFAVDLTIDPPILAGDLRSAPPAEIEVVDDTDDDRVAEWAWTTTTGFHDDGDPPEAMLRASAAFARRAGNTAFLARVDGVAAGGAVASVTSSDDGIVGAGLFGTSVMPAFRRRGIQQQLIAERLRLARERGAVLATIASNPGVATERNAAQFGFVLSYVKAVQSRPIPAHGVDAARSAGGEVGFYTSTGVAFVVADREVTR